MYFKVEKSKADDGRSPHGERGLKYDLYLVSSDYIKSLSSRRAWIEMRDIPNCGDTYRVALLTESVD